MPDALTCENGYVTDDPCKKEAEWIYANETLLCRDCAVDVFHQGSGKFLRRLVPSWVKPVYVPMAERPRLKV